MDSVMMNTTIMSVLTTQATAVLLMIHQNWEMVRATEVNITLQNVATITVSEPNYYMGKCILFAIFVTFLHLSFISVICISEHYY